MSISSLYRLRLPIDLYCYPRLTRCLSKLYSAHTLPTRYECNRFIDRYGLLDSRSGIGTINIIACSCFEKIIDLIIILFASLHDGITSSSHSLPSYKYIRHEAFLISHFRFQFLFPIRIRNVYCYNHNARTIRTDFRTDGSLSSLRF